MRLAGKTCIVTGAARGIGKAIGLRLASEGANVVFADIEPKQAEAAAAEATKAGGKAIGADVDVTNREKVRSLVARAVSEFGQLNVMFNNAGLNHIQPFLETTEDNWDRIMRVNALGVLIGTQEAAKQMAEAAKSWANAERTTDDPAKREQMRQLRINGERARGQARLGQCRAVLREQIRCDLPDAVRCPGPGVPQDHGQRVFARGR